MGASYSAVPGPLAHGAAVVSVELWPPAAWVEGAERELSLRLDRHPPAPQLEGAFQPRWLPVSPLPTPSISPPPQPHYRDQALSIL